MAYNDDSEGRFQGPFPTQFFVGEGTLRVNFDNGNADIEVRESTEPWPVGYEVILLSSFIELCEFELCKLMMEMQTLIKVGGNTKPLPWSMGYFQSCHFEFSELSYPYHIRMPL